MIHPLSLRLISCSGDSNQAPHSSTAVTKRLIPLPRPKAPCGLIITPQKLDQTPWYIFPGAWEIASVPNQARRAWNWMKGAWLWIQEG